MDIYKVKEFLPVPKQVNDIGTTDMWKVVELDMYMKLPDDYKLFIDTYGTGAIGDFLLILTPFSENENMNLKTKKDIMLGAYDYSKGI